MIFGFKIVTACSMTHSGIQLLLEIAYGLVTMLNDSRFRGSYYHINRYSIQNASDMNTAICDPRNSTNREGRFCGRCKKNYGLAAYSYHYASCIPCTDYGYKNWLRYFAVALLPLTLFYFLLVTFKINVNSSHLNGLVFIFQCVSSPVQLYVVDGWFASNKELHFTFVLIQIALSLFGIVNLDFFRTLYPYFCLHPDLNILHIASLDFIVAVYPFVLIALTYLLG